MAVGVDFSRRPLNLDAKHGAVCWNVRAALISQDSNALGQPSHLLLPPWLELDAYRNFTRGGCGGWYGTAIGRLCGVGRGTIDVSAYIFNQLKELLLICVDSFLWYNFYMKFQK